MNVTWLNPLATERISLTTALHPETWCRQFFAQLTEETSHINERRCDEHFIQQSWDGSAQPKDVHMVYGMFSMFLLLRPFVSGKATWTARGADIQLTIRYSRMDMLWVAFALLAMAIYTIRDVRDQPLWMAAIIILWLVMGVVCLRASYNLQRRAREALAAVLEMPTLIPAPTYEPGPLAIRVLGASSFITALLMTDFFPSEDVPTVLPAVVIWILFPLVPWRWLCGIVVGGFGVGFLTFGITTPSLVASGVLLSISAVLLAWDLTCLTKDSAVTPREEPQR